MRIDWSDAVKPSVPYVRVVVVRSDQEQVQVSIWWLQPSPYHVAGKVSSHLAALDPA